MPTEAIVTTPLKPDFGTDFLLIGVASYIALHTPVVGGSASVMATCESNVGCASALAEMQNQWGVC